jgi:hypothetical protein
MILEAYLLKQSEISQDEFELRTNFDDFTKSSKEKLTR